MGDISPKLELNRFDVIIIHYSLSLLYDHFLSDASKQRLQEFSGLKVLFVQDEYRQINKMVSEIERINFDVLFTCFPEVEIENIYPKFKLPYLAKYNTLTGYIPQRLLEYTPIKKIMDRPIDVGYRGRKIPFWLGELAYDKYLIAEQWSTLTCLANLTTDISYHENDRIYGHKWIEYISSCKTMLGVESGSSVMDFTGKLEVLINHHQEKYPDDSFYEIQKIYLMEHEGRYKLNQISPRCFEAIALKSTLILYEGEYSGILVPDRHYIMLKKDFSNITEVIASVKDVDKLQNIADIAYEEIALDPKYSYYSFIKKVDRIIGSEFKLRCKSKVLAQLEYTDIKFKLDIKQSDISFEISNNLNFEIIEYDTKQNNVDLNIAPTRIGIHNEGLLAQLMAYILKIVSRSQKFKQLRFFLTHKIKVFNPILRIIKTQLIRFN